MVSTKELLDNLQALEARKKNIQEYIDQCLDKIVKDELLSFIERGGSANNPKIRGILADFKKEEYEKMAKGTKLPEIERQIDQINRQLAEIGGTSA